MDKAKKKLVAVSRIVDINSRIDTAINNFVEKCRLESSSRCNNCGTFWVGIINDDMPCEKCKVKFNTKNPYSSGFDRNIDYDCFMDFIKELKEELIGE